MKAQAIWLETTRVVGQDEDGESKKEVIVTKLMSGQNWLNFVKHLRIRGFSRKNPPKVLKVIDYETNKEVKSDIEKYQLDVNNIMSPPKEVKVDHAAENKQLKEQMAALMAKVEEMAKGPAKTERQLIVEKANELELKFAKNIKSDKLLDMILEVDPDFTLNIGGQ